MWDFEQTAKQTPSNLQIGHFPEGKTIQTCHIPFFLFFKKGLVGKFVWPFKEAVCAVTPAKDNLNTWLPFLYWSVQWLWVLAQVILGMLHSHEKEFTATWNKGIEIILARNSHSEKSHLNSFCACIQLDAVEQEHILNVISSQTFSLSRMTLENPPFLLQVS